MIGDDMADNTKDVRTKVSTDVHMALAALAAVDGVDISEILRGLIVKHIEQEKRRARMLVSLMSFEGTAGNAGD